MAAKKLVRGRPLSVDELRALPDGSVVWVTLKKDPYSGWRFNEAVSVWKNAGNEWALGQAKPGWKPTEAFPGEQFTLSNPSGGKEQAYEDVWEGMQLWHVKEAAPRRPKSALRSDAELLAMASRFDLVPESDPNGPVRVEKRGEGAWAVVHWSSVLNKKGEWEPEPQVSSRSDAFKRRTRFPTPREAMDAYAKVKR